MTTKNDQEHCQEKPRKVKVNPIHTKQTLNIKSKPKTTNMELESSEALIRWVLIVDRKFLNTVLWDELKTQVLEGILEEEPWKVSSKKWPWKNLSETWKCFEEITRNTTTILGGRVVYYESLKWELKTKPINECRCDERLQTYCLLWIDEAKAKDKTFIWVSVMGEHVFLKW